MATNTLTHSEICSVAANRIKGCTAEQMDNSLKTYTQAMMDLAKEKKPMSTKDPALAIETPLVGYRINYHENGIVKNADGTETKIGANWTVNAAVPKALPMELNAETVGKIIGGVQKAAGVLGAIGKAVASAC